MRLLAVLLALGLTAHASATTRGFKNNNPGNLRSKDWTRYPGATGTDEGDHLIFRTSALGIKAMRGVLVAYSKKHHIRTIDGVCRRWVRKPRTPLQELHLRRYIACVAGRMGRKPHEPLDMCNPRTLSGLAKALIYAENSAQPYSEAVFRGVFRY